MGLRNAPLVFAAWMSWALDQLPPDLRAHVKNVSDDVVCGAQTYAEADTRLSHIRRHLESLGAYINLAKNSQHPTKELEALGFRIH